MGRGGQEAAGLLFGNRESKTRQQTQLVEAGRLIDEGDLAGAIDILNKTAPFLNENTTAQMEELVAKLLAGRLADAGISDPLAEQRFRAAVMAKLVAGELTEQHLKVAREEEVAKLRELLDKGDLDSLAKKLSKAHRGSLLDEHAPLNGLISDLTDRQMDAAHITDPEQRQAFADRVREAINLGELKGENLLVLDDKAMAIAREDEDGSLAGIINDIRASSFAPDQPRLEEAIQVAVDRGLSYELRIPVSLRRRHFSEEAERAEVEMLRQELPKAVHERLADSEEIDDGDLYSPPFPIEKAFELDAPGPRTQEWLEHTVSRMFIYPAGNDREDHQNERLWNLARGEGQAQENLRELLIAHMEEGQTIRGYDSLSLLQLDMSRHREVLQEATATVHKRMHDTSAVTFCGEQIPPDDSQFSWHRRMPEGWDDAPYRDRSQDNFSGFKLPSKLNPDPCPGCEETGAKWALLNLNQRPDPRVVLPQDHVEQLRAEVGDCVTEALQDPRSTWKSTFDAATERIAGFYDQVALDLVHKSDHSSLVQEMRARGDRSNRGLGSSLFMEPGAVIPDEVWLGAFKAARDVDDDHPLLGGGAEAFRGRLSAYLAEHYKDDPRLKDWEWDDDRFDDEDDSDE